MGRINELRYISDADIRNYIPASKKSLLTLIEHRKEIMMKSKKSAQQYSSLIPEGRRPTAPHARPVHRSDATTKLPLMYTILVGVRLKSLLSLRQIPLFITAFYAANDLRMRRMWRTISA